MATLGFSFWQLLCLALVLIFRTEVRQIAQRVSKLKLAGGEVLLERETTQIDDLLQLKSSISDKHLSDLEIKEEIDQKIRKRSIGALINIKKNTSFLWDIGLRKNNNFAVAQIRKNTLASVQPDIDLLEELGHISLEKEKAYEAFDGDLVYQVSITLESDEVRALILEAQGY